MKNQKQLIPKENSLVLINESDVEAKIVIIRGNPVIADADVAELYDVETRIINEAVKNNPNMLNYIRKLISRSKPPR